MTEGQHVTIPVPLVAPFGTPLDKPEYVQEVWDAFVKPGQESGIPQSMEMRLLMAILRAVHEGLQTAHSDTATAPTNPSGSDEKDDATHG